MRRACSSSVIGTMTTTEGKRQSDQPPAACRTKVIDAQATQRKLVQDVQRIDNARTRYPASIIIQVDF